MAGSDRFRRCCRRPARGAANRGFADKPGDTADPKHRGAGAWRAAPGNRATTSQLFETPGSSRTIGSGKSPGRKHIERRAGAITQGELGRAFARFGRHHGKTERDIPKVNWPLLKNSLLVACFTTLL